MKTFLMPSDLDGTFVMLKATDEFVAWAGRAKVSFDKVRALDPSLDNMRFLTGDFEFITFTDKVDEEIAETVEAMLDNLMLPAPLDPEQYELQDKNEKNCIIVSARGIRAWSAVTDIGSVCSFLLAWNELGIDVDDLIRCRYNDCKEEHPVAGESELVTCHTCRKELALEGGGEK